MLRYFWLQRPHVARGPLHLGVKTQTKTSSACGPVLALASIKNSFVTWLSLVMSSYSIAMRNAFIKWARAPLAAALPFVKVFDAVCINTEILSPTTDTQI